MTERLSTYIIQGSGGVFIYESEWGHEYGDFFFCVCMRDMQGSADTCSISGNTYTHESVCAHTDCTCFIP